MAETLTALHAKITGDASQFKSEMQSSIGLLNQYGRKIIKTSADTEKTAKKSTAALTRLKKAIDPVYASTQKYERAVSVLDSQMEAGNITEAERTRLLQQASAAYLQSGKSADMYTRQIRTSRFHTANLMAQFNDIGVMLASGQSPLTLAMQQGTQLNQTFAQLGGTKQILAGIKEGLLAMVTPVSLLTIGLIAGGTALARWGFSALTAEKDTTKFEDALKSLGEEYDKLKTKRAKEAGGFQTESELEVNNKLIERKKELAAAEERLNNLKNAGVATDEGMVLAQKAQVSTLRQGVNELETQLQQVGTAREEYRRWVTEIDNLTDSERMLGEQMIEAQNKKNQALADGIKFGRQELKNQEDKIALLSMEQQFGKNSVAYKRLEAQIEQEQYSTMLKKNNVQGELYTQLMNTFRAAQSLKTELQNALTPMDTLTAQALLLAERMGISADNAAAYNDALNKAAGINFDKGGLSFGLPGANTTGTSGSTFSYDGSTLRGAAKDYKPGEKPKKGGGGAKTNPLENQIQQLQESLMTQEELEMASYAKRQEMLTEALDQKILTKQQYADLEEQIAADHQQKMSALEQQAMNVRLDMVAGGLGDLASLMQTNNKKLFKIGQAAAIAEATVKGYQAAVDAWQYGMAHGGPGVAAALTAASLVKTGSLISQIASQSPTGGKSGGGGAASAGPAASAPTNDVYYNVNLVGEGPISKSAVRGLISMINDEVRDGAVIRGITTG